MTSDDRTTLRRARLGVSLLFLTNGAMLANALPRYPEIKSDLALSNAAYGLAIAALPAGALIAGLTAAALIRRFRSSRVAVVATFLTAAAGVAIGIAPTAWALAGAFFLFGAMDAITDVAQNAHGLLVQRRYGRSILNSFHAIWSAGAVLGGLMGAGAVALEIPRGLHLAISGVLFSLVALAAYPLLLRGPESAIAAGVADGEEAPAAAVTHLTPRTLLMLAALGLIAIAGVLVEDAGSTWAAVYLDGSLGAPGALAAFGYIALVGAQFVGRIVGDRMVDRFGQRAVARTGGAITALGMGAAIAFPSVPLTIVGFGLAGFGVATLVPGAMHAADELPGFKQGTGLMLLTWLMRAGFLVSPPLVGAVADATSLRTGLLVVPLAGLVVVALSGVLEGRRSVPETVH